MTSRRRKKVRKGWGSLEFLESRLLLSDGFVQGFVLDNSSNPIGGALVQLLNPSDSPVASTKTNSGGYYAFNNVPTGNYEVVESAPGYTATGTNIQTTIDPANATTVNGSTAISVTVEDLASYPTITLTNASLPYAPQLSAYFQLNANAPYNNAGPFNGNTEGGDAAGQFNLTFSNNLGNITGSADNVLSFCADLFHGINTPPPTIVFTVKPSLVPDSTTQPGLSTTIGEIGYLYSTYGLSLPSSGPPTTGTPTQVEQINGAGLQLALWALEYNQMPASGPMTLADPNTPFQVNSSTSSSIINAANWYLDQAYNNSEEVYFLSVVSSISGGSQGMLCTDLLSFTDSPEAQPAITTTASEAGNVVGSAVLSDTAHLSGGDNPTGTITFALTGPDGNPVTLPATDASVPVNGNGDYTTPVGITATEVGTYTWTASYGGDSNNLPAYEPATSTEVANESVTTVQASPAITTTASEVGSVVGIAVLTDTARLTGGDNPTGTITFYLFAPGVTPNANNSNNVYSDTVTVNGDGTYDMSTGTNPGGYAPTATGTYQWVAVYSGDSGNNATTEPFGSEPDTVASSSPVGKGDFATIGFWRNRNGKAVLCSFGSDLGTWLATNFSNLFGLSTDPSGNLAGKTGAQIYAIYSSLPNNGNGLNNTYLQAFAVALGIYADTTSLGGATLVSNGLAAKYGFTVSAPGGIAATFDVGSNGAAFGVANGTSLSVTQILTIVANNYSPSTGFFNGNKSLGTDLNSVLNGINQAGDIS
jgi:hypothetical protein